MTRNRLKDYGDAIDCACLECYHARQRTREAAEIVEAWRKRRKELENLSVALSHREQSVGVREQAADVADWKLRLVCGVTLAIHVALVAVNRGWV